MRQPIILHATDGYRLLIGAGFMAAEDPDTKEVHVHTTSRLSTQVHETFDEIANAVDAQHVIGDEEAKARGAPSARAAVGSEVARGLTSQIPRPDPAPSQDYQNARAAVELAGGDGTACSVSGCGLTLGHGGGHRPATIADLADAVAQVRPPWTR